MDFGHLPSLRPDHQATRLAFWVMPMEVEPIVVEYITIIINLRESLSYVNLSDSDMTFIFFFTSYRPMFSLLIHGQEY